jgi:hypothetical protein
MNVHQPDIVVTGPDGEYLMIVEVKFRDTDNYAIKQLKGLMAATGCSVGLVIADKRVILLRDSLEKSNGASVRIVGEAELPSGLLPPADEQWKGEPGLELESRVQRWLETLKFVSSKSLPEDLKALFDESILNLLRIGEIRAAGPRWSKATK